ncbi:MAG: AAA domain-containing protein, partial [Firmicutes bacterium]|nr:AAA domain-containing protein [Bacillota bacterium]
VSTTLPTNINVQVGTIHGFQGDECDIIIALFNPPPSISASKEMFLNKLNIINVSISRARDYLFVMMPDDDTENIGNLTLIKRVEKLCKEQLEWTEQRSEAIEELMFESKSFLVDNSFSTSHQLVNVYGKVEKRYEVRSEDTAVDVQIHET